MDLQPALITSWHAHVYFDAARRDAAWALRERIASELAGRGTLGRFHEKPVGPHPMGSVQFELPPSEFAFVASWLALNHGELDVFMHPNTDDALRDHRDSALWIGHRHELRLDALRE